MPASAPPSERHFPRRKAIWIAVAVIVALAIGLPTITLGRLQARILRLLTAELGRPVTAQSVHLVLFPWPGVELDQVRLADAPDFGGEALATAQSARATLRIWALFGGRLEFSSIHLDQANINLARDPGGRWNLAALLSQVHRTGPRLRPTAAPGSLRQAGRFPYLAIQDSRINFKFGLRKEPFYLNGVSASLSLVPQGWRFHLQFSPQRSDLDLSNTGVVTTDGLWFRPRPGRPAHSGFDLAAHLRGSYLAAASALLLGHDGGIHGVARLDLQIRGSAQRFRITGVVQARQLRRWDQLPSSLRLAIPFAASYTSATDTVRLRQFGNGTDFNLQGRIASLLTHPQADLTLTARQLPTAALLPLARAFAPALPPDITAQGLWNGRLTLTNAPAGLGARVSGTRGEPGSPTRSSTRWGRSGAPWGGEAALRPAPRHWSVQGQIAAVTAGLREGQLRLRLTAPVCRAQRSHGLECTAREAQITGPDHARATVDLAVDLDRQGAALRLSGRRVTVADVAALGQLFGVAAPWPYQLSGAAQVDFRRGLSWAALRGYATPAAWQGQVVWQSATLRLPVLPAPLPLQHLDLRLGPAQAIALRTNARLGGAVWRLALRRPAPSAPWTFSVRTGQVSLPRLAAALVPQAPQGFLARLFSHPATWLSLAQMIHAQGQLAIAAVHWHGHAAALAATIQADGPAWRFPSVRLHLPGGAISGRARYQSGILRFTGQGRNLRLQSLLADSPYAQALRGRGNLEIRLALPLPPSGGPMTATGKLTVQPGAFPLLRTAAGTPLRFHRYQTQFAWNDGVLQLSHGRLWPATASEPSEVTVRLQPPLPPRLDWAQPAPPGRAAVRARQSSRTAVVGVWPPPRPASNAAPVRDPRHAHHH